MSEASGYSLQASQSSGEKKDELYLAYATSHICAVILLRNCPSLPPLICIISVLFMIERARSRRLKYSRNVAFLVVKWTDDKSVGKACFVFSRFWHSDDKLYRQPNKAPRCFVAPKEKQETTWTQFITLVVRTYVTSRYSFLFTSFCRRLLFFSFLSFPASSILVGCPSLTLWYSFHTFIFLFFFPLAIALWLKMFQLTLSCIILNLIFKVYITDDSA